MPLPSAEASGLAPEIRNWTGRPSLAVRISGRSWILKVQSPDDRRRELAVSRLGRGLVNVVHTRGLTPREHRQVVDRGLVEPGTPLDAVLLSRLASEYRRRELPARSLEAALGGELCFSLWVRRRDPHVWNRAFTTDGLPVFFDLHATLDFEPELRDLDQFFANDLAGYGGSWRVHVNEDLPTITRAARTNRDISLVHVRSEERTRDAARGLVGSLQRRARSARRILRATGHSRAEALELADFLRSTAEVLPVALDRMWEVAVSRRPVVPSPELVPDDLG
jgi:hypothetical protein